MLFVSPQQQKHCQGNASDVHTQKNTGDGGKKQMFFPEAMDGIIPHQQRSGLNAFETFAVEHLKNLGGETWKQQQHEQNDHSRHVFIDV